MSDRPSHRPSSPSISADGPSRGRGRGKSRGGLGKYLRARGRGRGRGRPAEFGKRLVLEDEEVEIDPDSEEAKEFDKKYSRRQLGSNADRYAEPEPVLNSDGEVEEEPEVDLSAFLERQRLEDAPTPMANMSHAQPDDDIDTTLAHLPSKAPASSQSRKGKVQEIAWDEELEEMTREKAVAEAQRDLKARFRANAEKQRSRNIPRNSCLKSLSQAAYIEAPPLPTEATPPSNRGKEELQDFLDDLLS